MLSLWETIRSGDKKLHDNKLDYRGEIMVCLHNHGKVPQIIEPGERIAQLVIVPYLRAEFKEVEELEETERGSGGFGSTGTK